MLQAIKTILRKWWQGRISRWVMLGGAVLFLLSLLGWALLKPAADPMLSQPAFAVVKGPLTINVIESGTIKPLQQQIIKSRVEGQAAIIYLIPEGTQVKPGDLLVQLDASQLEEKLAQQQITVQNAEAAFVRSRENVAVVESQGESDVSKAELNHQFAKEDLINYLEGDYPKELKELESKLTLAQEQLKTATEKLRWSQLLYNEKYLSQTELEADRLAKQRNELDLELAQTNLNLLKRFTYKRKVDQFTSNVEQTRLTLERAQRIAKANNIQAQADLRAKQSEYERQKTRQDKLEEQIAFCRMTAPTGGMVVYATSTQTTWRGNVDPLAEGQMVRERQELIFLPTSTNFMAQISIHESKLEKIRLGQEVQLKVDAVPGKVYQGRLTKIAPLPDAQSVFMNPDLKVYITEITLDGDQDQLRTGMSCQAEVLVEQYDQAIYVPVQAVLRINGQPTVWRLQGKQIIPTPVELGLDNNNQVRIISGLGVGDQVMLNPPLAEAGRSLEKKTNGKNRGNRSRPSDADPMPAVPSSPPAAEKTGAAAPVPGS